MSRDLDLGGADVAVAFHCVLDESLAGTVGIAFGGDRRRLEVIMPWAEVTFFEYPHGEVEAALRRRDPTALYSLHPEFAPFWCPVCASIYCADHWWRFEVEEDGFHEETRGSCPRGHERMLLD